MSSPRSPSGMHIIKICIVALAIAAIVFAQLGPGDWQLRTGLGWQTEHVLAYFAVTSIACLVWSRPFVVGPALMAASMLLEAAQRLTQDRSANLQAGLYGAAGALAAALLVALVTRAWRWRTPLKAVKIGGTLAVVAVAVLLLVPWQLRPHTGDGKGDAGPPGPAGPRGPAGPPGPAARGPAVRTITAP